MATPEAALIAALQAAPNVAALAGGRVFVAGARQGTDYPYVTVQRISTAGAAYLDGPSNLEWPRFQIDAWSTKASEALALGEAIRGVIDAIELTAGGLTFHATFQDQRGPAPDEETRNFRLSSDYLIWHERN
jgi:hypothetical protein